MNEIQGLLLHVLVQLAVIITAARVGALLLSKLGQPQVVGEIVAGLVVVWTGGRGRRGGKNDGVWSGGTSRWVIMA